MGTFTIEANDKNFDEIVLKSELPVLLDFWAPWCGPCKSIGPSLEKLAEEFQGRVKIVKINIDENPETAQRYAVRAIPFLVTFANGSVQAQVAGAQTQGKMKEMLDDLQW